MTPETILANALARAKANRLKYGHLTDAERISALPRQDFSQSDTLVAKWTSKLERPNNDTTLFHVQAEALETAKWAAAQPEPIGMVGNIRVGGGKTLIFNLLPEVFNAQRPVLLLPPEMVAQYEHDLFEWSQKYNFRVPTIVKYSMLSRPEGTDLLRRLNPDLIMADEAQALRHSSSARTKRFLRYMSNHPSTRFVAMSGTLTGSTLSDYAHLCHWALRDYSPLPHRKDVVDLWGSVLNAEGEPDHKAWESLSWLDASAAGDHSVKRIREAFRRRFASTPGVITTFSSSCDAELVLTAEYPAMGQEVKDAMTVAADDYALPDGTGLVDALHFHRAINQLSVGFYYVWEWPEGEKDKPWLEARKEWWSACRSYLKRHSREGCDSPFLVEDYVRKTRKPLPLYNALLNWDTQRHKDPPPTRAVWLDYTAITHAVQWALARERCFLWWRSRAVGEALEAFGLPVFGQGAGRPDKDAHPRAALSIAVHHKGRNYQAWDDQYMVESVGSAAWMEQLMGRTHRHGQAADKVGCSIPQSTWAQRQQYQKALNRSRYIQQTTGQPQKLLISKKRGFI